MASAIVDAVRGKLAAPVKKQGACMVIQRNSLVLTTSSTFSTTGACFAPQLYGSLAPSRLFAPLYPCDSTLTALASPRGRALRNHARSLHVGLGDHRSEPAGCKRGSKSSRKKTVLLVNLHSRDICFHERP